MLTLLLELQELDSIMKTSRKTLLVMVHSVTNTDVKPNWTDGRKKIGSTFSVPKSETGTG